MDTSLVTVYHSEKSSGRKHIGILYSKNRTGAAPLSNDSFFFSPVNTGSDNMK